MVHAAWLFCHIHQVVHISFEPVSVKYLYAFFSGFHDNDSEVTLNVCLGKQFPGGELFFRGIQRDKTCQYGNSTWSKSILKSFSSTLLLSASNFSFMAFYKLELFIYYVFLSCIEAFVAFGILLREFDYLRSSCLSILFWDSTFLFSNGIGLLLLLFSRQLWTIPMSPAVAVLHRGHHRRSARATTAGRQVNLLLWCRRYNSIHLTYVFL